MNTNSHRLFRIYSWQDQVCIAEIDGVPFCNLTKVYGGVKLGFSGLSSARISSFNQIAGYCGDFETFCLPENLDKTIHEFNRRYKKARPKYIKRLFKFICKQVSSFYFGKLKTIEIRRIETNGFETNFVFLVNSFNEYSYNYTGFLNQQEFDSIVTLFKEMKNEVKA